jgi:hypothetical protein
VSRTGQVPFKAYAIHSPLSRTVNVSRSGRFQQNAQWISSRPLTDRRTAGCLECSDKSVTLSLSHKRGCNHSPATSCTNTPHAQTIGQVRKRSLYGGYECSDPCTHSPHNVVIACYLACLLFHQEWAETDIVGMYAFFVLPL